MKLYVGTYAAYNRGSLRGAWLDLDKFENKDAFMAACRRLHRSERDPEFMFQDYEATEDWESGFYSESFIDQEYWKVAAEMRAEKIAKATKGKPDAEARAEYAKLLPEVWGSDKKMIDFCLKKAAYIVKLSGGEYVEIERPGITTSHCEGEDDGRGRSMKDAQAGCDYFRTEQGFKYSNIREFDREMVAAVGRSEPHSVFGRSRRRAVNVHYCNSPRDSKICSFYPVELNDDGTPGFRSSGFVRFANDEDLKIMRRAYAYVRADFIKRVNAYWKRFGASKLRTWTYWTEA